MKKKISLISAFALTLCLFFSFFAFGAQAAEKTYGKCGESVNWKLDDEGVMTIYGKGAMWDFRDDADFYDYHECPWENLKSKIKKVVIKSGVTYIGADAFDFCTKLKKVSFPSTLTGIGNFAFLGCKSLLNFKLPDGLTSIGQQAFDGCEKITKVVIPDSVTFLDAGIFGYCTSLTDVYIGGDKNVGCYISSNCLFRECTALEEIKVSPDNIGLSAVDGVLYNKEKTLLIQYPAGKKDKKFTFPSSVREFMRFSIEGNDYIERFVFREGMEYFDECSVMSCKNLKYVIIPSTVVAIGADNFFHCNNLVYIENRSKAYWTCNSDGTWVNSKGNSFKELGKGVAYKLYTSFKAGENKYKLTSPKTVAFTGVRSTKYTDVVIPDEVTFGTQSFKVTAIGQKALCRKNFVKSVKIGANVKTINSYAFYMCTGLEKITLPSKVSSIGRAAFAGCTRLSSIKITSLNLSKVGDVAFKNIAKNAVIRVPAEKYKDYSALLKSKGQPSGVVVKKY